MYELPLDPFWRIAMSETADAVISALQREPIDIDQVEKLLNEAARSPQ